MVTYLCQILIKVSIQVYNFLGWKNMSKVNKPNFMSVRFRGHEYCPWSNIDYTKSRIFSWKFFSHTKVIKWLSRTASTKNVCMKTKLAWITFNSQKRLWSKLQRIAFWQACILLFRGSVSMGSTGEWNQFLNKVSKTCHFLRNHQ